MENIVEFMLRDIINHDEWHSRKFIHEVFGALTDDEWDEVVHKIDAAFYWNTIIAHQVARELDGTLFDYGDIVDKIKEFQLDQLNEYDTFNRACDQLDALRAIRVNHGLIAG